MIQLSAYTVRTLDPSLLSTHGIPKMHSCLGRKIQLRSLLFPQRNFPLVSFNECLDWDTDRILGLSKKISFCFHAMKNMYVFKYTSGFSC